MRTTKALLCAAAVAAGAVTAMAQSNVYSLNVVGYINVPLVEGFNLVANQLDVDGTGTNNTIVGVLSNSLPAGASVYTWGGASYNFASYVKNKAGTATNWSGSFTSSLNPGQAAWIAIPSGAFGGTTQSVTTVGNVLQGSLVNPYLAPAGGYNFLSSMTPVAGGLQAALKYPAAAGDGVYLWNGTTYNFSSYVKNKAGTATNWSPSEPIVGVAQGFWLNTFAGQVWSNYFIVQ